MAYKQTSKFTCGPSAYLEAFCIVKCPWREKKFHEKGRIKPSKAFLGVSFLEINPKLRLYIQDKRPRISEKFIKLVHNFENLKGKMTYEELKKNMEQHYAYLLKKHSSNIKKTGEDSFFKLLNQIAKSGRVAILLTHSKYWLKEKGVLHWIVLKGMKNNKYVCADPNLGKELLFSGDDIRRQMALVKKENFPLQFVTNS